MAAALAITGAAFILAPERPARLDRLTVFAGCCAIAAVWLLFAVALLARHRFFSADDIDGAALTEATPKARVLQALIQNTLEQTVLAAAAYGAW
jgi:hypothetical protein